jgi:hypothetical protein
MLRAGKGDQNKKGGSEVTESRPWPYRLSLRRLEWVVALFVDYVAVLVDKHVRLGCK